LFRRGKTASIHVGIDFDAVRFYIIPVTFIVAALLGFLAGFGTTVSPDPASIASKSRSVRNTTFTSGETEPRDEFKPFYPDGDLERALERASLHASELHREYALLEAVSGLTVDEIRRIIDAGSFRYGDTTSFDGTYDFLQITLIRLWAQREPRSAAEYAKHQYELRKGDGMIEVVAEIWMRSEPTSALEWVSGLSSKLRDEAVVHMVSGYLDEQGSKPFDLVPVALKHVREAPGSFDARSIFWSVIGECISRDPDAVLALANSLPESYLRGDVYKSLLYHKFGNDPRSVLGHTPELEAIRKADAGQWDVVVSYIMDKLLRTDIVAAQRFAKSLPDAISRRTMLGWIVQSLHEQNPAAARALVEQVPVEESYGLGGYYSAWGSADPVAAIQHGLRRLDQFVSDGVARKDFEAILRRSLIRSNCKSERAPAMAEFLSRQTDPFRESLLVDVFAAWAETDLSAAKSWAAALPPGAKRDYAFAGIAESERK
jgi:hypothetical protein